MKAERKLFDEPELPSSVNPSTVDPGPNGTLLDYLTAVSVTPDAAFAAGTQGTSPGG